MEGGGGESEGGGGGDALWHPSDFHFRPYSNLIKKKNHHHHFLLPAATASAPNNNYININSNDADSTTVSTTRRRPPPQALRVVVRKPAVVRLTKDIVETYKTCNPQFNYSEDLNPKRFLTSPSAGVLNDGHDNANSDLILAVNLVLVNLDSQRRYIVKDILGQGTFGQVAKCWVADSSSFVAVKIIKNQPAYYQQALVEVSILTTLNRKFDPEDKHHIVRIYDYFVYHRHLCIAFELLDTNLFELIKINHFRGLSLSIVQLFSKQILRGLALLKDAAVIHCDLKPENILLCTSVKPAEVKIIDFGSACMEDRTVYSYIQSRYYRSPEVLLGYQYTTSIDMWSFGCIVAELFLGLPLFPGASEFDLLRRMIKILGGQPPDYVLSEAKNTSKFFKFVGNANIEDSTSRRCAYQALSEEEYEARESKKPSIGKEYFNHMNLEAIVTKYPYRKNLPEEDVAKENQIRLALIDFLRGLVEFDPAKRWSPLQASKHPFVTGEPFTCPYKPPPETPRMPVSQNMKVDHHPAGGHWFAAGLSPNMSGRPRVAMHNSPHYQMLPYGYSGSYGSVGSHGGNSYNDGAVFGSSYGSYGDSNSNMLAYYSPAGPSWIKAGVAISGNSPDSRQRLKVPPGTRLGVSPSVGNFAPMSLGTSSSQFTPPGSYGHISAAGSPGGHFGPTSPARSSNSHGSPLGKMPATNHFNRRKSWGYSGTIHSEGSLSPQWHGDGSSFSSQTELHMQSNSNALRGSQHQQSGDVGNYSSTHKHDKHEPSISLPDPGDWDPNYSEELLLQEDSSEVSSMAGDFGKVMQLGQGLVPTESPVHSRRSSRHTRSSISAQRPNGPNLTYSGGEIGSPPSGYNLHAHPMTKLPPSHFHMPQSAPSRFGQQQTPPNQRFNQMRPISGGRGSSSEWNNHHTKVHPPSHSIYTSTDPHLPSNTFTSGPTSWGHKSNLPSGSIPPASRGRKDYGKIAQ